MCMCEVMSSVLCSAMNQPSPKRQRVTLRTSPPSLQAPPVQVNGVRVPGVTHIPGICDRIMDNLSWWDLARNLVPDKGTLLQVLSYLNDHPLFGDKRRKPNLDYNYDVWKRVYPLFSRAAASNLETLPLRSTECNLYWVHEGLGRSLYPFRQCHTLSLQTPCTLGDHDFQTLFWELGNWPHLQHLHLDFGHLPDWIIWLIAELPQLSQLVTLDLGSFSLPDESRDWFQSLSALQRLDYKTYIAKRWRRRRQSTRQGPGEWMDVSNWTQAQHTTWDHWVEPMD